ncbi:heme exporter protein CcmD [Rhodovulum sp. MB263]|uniref:heme exporter protein CcmD n=1 Tax=unclassified Rhodovulum TaxID=2631432 RepID=UPI0009B71DAF|nr:heme exporter protein CcmD [Rhodovulum sp. MB263]ARC88117.1 heme exporter protein CcmD [Rhodovulum sp. MB263]
MIPDLGKYAVAVLSSYALTMALIAVLIAVSLWRGARVRRQLAEVEARRETDV